MYSIHIFDKYKCFSKGIFLVSVRHDQPAPHFPYFTAKGVVFILLLNLLRHYSEDTLKAQVQTQ